jgi:hypothetical protein
MQQHRGLRTGFNTFFAPLVEHTLDGARDHSAIEAELGPHETSPHKKVPSLNAAELKD